MHQGEARELTPSPPRSGTPPRIVVRRIRPDEGGLLRELRLRSLADAPLAYGQTLAEAFAEPDAAWAEAARSGARGPRRLWIIAERIEPDGRRTPVGIATGRRRMPETLLIFSVWVDPSVRRRGVMRRLIGATERWAARTGARRTLLWVIAANEEAVAAYCALGFATETGTEDAERGAAFRALALSRPIAPGREA